MNKIIFLFLCISISISSLNAQQKVNQRIAVLEFELIGEGEYSFIASYIQKIFERELDRTGSINVIREYLWSNYYDAKLDINDINSIMDFGLKAKVEGVIFGSVDISSNKISIKYTIYDILKNSIAIQNKIISEKNERIFQNMEQAVKESVNIIKNKFLPIDPKIVVNERVERKKIYATSLVKPFEFRISLGARMNDADTVELPFIDYGGGTCRSNIYKNGAVSASIYAGFYFRYKRFGTIFDFAVPVSGDYKPLNFSLEFICWVMPETISLGIRTLLYSVKFDYEEIPGTISGVRDVKDVSGEFRNLMFFITIGLYPGEHIGFGLKWVIPYSPVQYYNYEGHNADKMGIKWYNFVLFYDIYIAKGVGIYFDMSMYASRISWPHSGIRDEEEWIYTQMYAALSVYYRFQWGGAKRGR